MTYWIGIGRKLCWLSADILCGRPPDLWPFQLQIGALISPALGNVHSDFSALFIVRVMSPYRMDRQTDRRTDGRTSKTRHAA